MPFLIPIFIGTAATATGAAATTGLIGSGGAITGAGLASGASLAMGGIGTIMSMQSAKAQAKSESAIAKYNVEMTRRAAETETARRESAGKFAYEQKLKERELILSRIRRTYGQSGFTSAGAPLLDEIETAKNITMDALMTQYNTRIGIQDVQQQAAQQIRLYKYQAKSAKRAGKLSMYQSLFSGASQIGSIYSNYALKAGAPLATS